MIAPVACRPGPQFTPFTVKYSSSAPSMCPNSWDTSIVSPAPQLPMFVVDVPTFTTWCSPDVTNWMSLAISRPSEQQQLRRQSLNREFHAAAIAVTHAERWAAVIVPTSRTRTRTRAVQFGSSSVNRKRARHPYVPFHASEPAGAFEIVSVRAWSISCDRTSSQRWPKKCRETQHHSHQIQLQMTM